MSDDIMRVRATGTLDSRGGLMFEAEVGLPGGAIGRAALPDQPKLPC